MLDDEPAVEAAIRLTIGRTYRDLGELERAEPHLEESLDLHLLTYPRESEPVTTAMNELGKLYSAQDRPEEIIALWTEVLELKRNVFGESHQTTIISISNLGSIYREQRRYAEALPLHEEAHRLAVRYLPPDNEWRIVSTRHLASMYRDLERYAEADAALASAEGLTKDEAQHALYRGLLALREGDDERAAPALERAARLASEIAVERLKLEVARLRRERFGTSSERSARIDQLVYVTRPGHKGIVLGRGGETIKAVGQAARAELMEFMGRPVHLFLQVKLRENWLEERERYTEMGLDFRDGDPEG